MSQAETQTRQLQVKQPPVLHCGHCRREIPPGAPRQDIVCTVRRGGRFSLILCGDCVMDDDIRWRYQRPLTPYATQRQEARRQALKQAAAGTGTATQPQPLTFKPIGEGLALPPPRDWQKAAAGDANGNDDLPF